MNEKKEEVLIFGEKGVWREIIWQNTRGWTPGCNDKHPVHIESSDDEDAELGSQSDLGRAQGRPPPQPPPPQPPSPPPPPPQPPPPPPPPPRDTTWHYVPWTIGRFEVDPVEDLKTLRNTDSRQESAEQQKGVGECLIRLASWVRPGELRDPQHPPSLADTALKTEVKNLAYGNSWQPGSLNARHVLHGEDALVVTEFWKKHYQGIRQKRKRVEDEAFQTVRDADRYRPPKKRDLWDTYAPYHQPEGAFQPQRRDEWAEGRPPTPPPPPTQPTISIVAYRERELHLLDLQRKW